MHIILSGGLTIPCIGFGPDQLGYTPLKKAHNNVIKRGINKVKRIMIDEPSYVNSISSAIESGYRLIDWSASYGLGTLIYKGIRKAGASRDQMVLTTRVSNHAQFNDRVEEEFFAQLSSFHTDYIDILMFHWPVTDYYIDTWKKMIKLKEEGYCRILGVANCHKKHLEAIYNETGVFPEINQVEIHPLFTQISLRQFCMDNSIQMEGYSPTARHDDRLYNPPIINNIAQKYKKTPTQIILRWHVQNGIIPITRSLNYSHQKENFDIFDFELSSDDMKKISDMNINARIRYDPDNCDFRAL